MKKFTKFQLYREYTQGAKQQEIADKYEIPIGLVYNIVIEQIPKLLRKMADYGVPKP